MLDTRVDRANTETSCAAPGLPRDAGRPSAGRATSPPDRSGMAGFRWRTSTVPTSRAWSPTPHGRGT